MPARIMPVDYDYRADLMRLVAHRCGQIGLTRRSYRRITGCDISRTDLHALVEGTRSQWRFDRLVGFARLIGIEVAVQTIVGPLPDEWVPKPAFIPTSVDVATLSA